MYFKSGIVAFNPSTQTGGRGRGEILFRKTKQRDVKKKKVPVELKLRRILVGSWVLPKQVPWGRTLFSSVGLCGWGAVRWAQARWSWLPRPHWLFRRVMECQASGPLESVRSSTQLFRFQASVLPDSKLCMCIQVDCGITCTSIKFETI